MDANGLFSDIVIKNPARYTKLGLAPVNLFYVKFSRAEKMLDSFSRIGVKISLELNSTLNKIKIFSRTKYRKVIKSLLEDFLQSEDDYVAIEVPRFVEIFSSLSSLLS